MNSYLPLHECDANLGVRRYTKSTLTNKFGKAISVLRGILPDDLGRETAADPSNTPRQQQMM